MANGCHESSPTFRAITERQSLRGTTCPADRAGAERYSLHMRYLVVPLTMFALFSSPPAQAQAASPGAFKGVWGGHTRSLTVNRHGVAKEVIYSGCCVHALTMFLRLSHVRGGSKHGRADVEVIRIKHVDRDSYSDEYPAPQVGQNGTFRLHAGVIKESVSGTNYCNQKAGNRGACGA